MTDVRYYLPMYERLEPRTPFKGGRIGETDPLTLAEAASMATKHAGETVTIGDFLRAAARGEITLRAIVHQTAKLQRIGGGVYCNAGQPNENTVPAGCILNLPLSACSKLAATGRASWREFDSFESIDGILMRYVIAELMPDEPDFETTTDDCRVTGNHVHALADAFIGEPAPEQASPEPVAPSASDAPVATESPEQRRARWLDLYGMGERGAVQRVFERELLTNPKADRSFIGKEIKTARQEKQQARPSGNVVSQLVQSGKRQR